MRIPQYWRGNPHACVGLNVRKYSRTYTCIRPQLADEGEDVVNACAADRS
jgi:hypothetical protein